MKTLLLASGCRAHRARSATPLLRTPYPSSFPVTASFEGRRVRRLSLWRGTQKGSAGLGGGARQLVNNGKTLNTYKSANAIGSGHLAAMISVYIVWGSTYLAIRFAVQTMRPF